MDILFLPGYACSSAVWEPLRTELPAHYAATSLDWPRGSTPGFHSLRDFAGWLSVWLGDRRFDCIVGHSMGGLAALQLLAAGSEAASRLVLMESFVLPPPPFFRNLVLRDSAAEAQAVRTMLALERPYYSPALAESLREADFTQEVRQLDVPVHALHGDRGCGDPERVRGALGWPEALSRRVELAVIPGACHFPMLENPRHTGEALRRILG